MWMYIQLADCESPTLKQNRQRQRHSKQKFVLINTWCIASDVLHILHHTHIRSVASPRFFSSSRTIALELWSSTAYRVENWNESILWMDMPHRIRFQMRRAYATFRSFRTISLVFAYIHKTRAASTNDKWWWYINAKLWIICTSFSSCQQV